MLQSIFGGGKCAAGMRNRPGCGTLSRIELIDARQNIFNFPKYRA
jgi:hypothetical protein